MDVFDHQIMLLNLGIGTLVIGATVLVHALGLITLTQTSDKLNGWLVHRFSGRVLAIQATVVGLFLIHTIEVCIWSLVYLTLYVVPHLEEAVYFSTVTFSTIGFGDVVLLPRWRLLSSLEGINGFLPIGWSTAYLVAASTRHGPFRLGEHF